MSRCFLKLLLFFLSLISIQHLAPTHLRAAPCCARSAAAPFLILGDDRAQVGLGYAYSNTVAKATRDGATAFLPADRSEYLQAMRMDGATLLSDLWQAGVGIPLIKNSLSTPDIHGSSTGLGDVRLNLGYEFLPSWSYSVWKPQGYLFAVATLPTGRSPYESHDRVRTDITGNGFYSFAVGSVLLKRWKLWDAFILPEAHYAPSRTFEIADAQVRATPGFGGSLGFGLGYSPGGGRIRVGMRVQPRVDQGLLSQSPQGIYQGGTIASCDTGFDLSYLFGDQDTLMTSYTDQTLLGFASNTNLNRMLAISFLHRWQR